MKCERCQRLLSERVDGDLSPRLARAVDEHLAGCAVCVAVESELRAMSGMLRGLPGAAPEEALWGRIDAALDADERERERRRPRWPVLAPALGGAALLATVGVAQGLRSEARRSAEAVDEQLRAQSTAALRQARLAQEGLEREVLGAVPAARQPGEAELAPGIDGIEASLAARQQHLLEVAERWPGDDAEVRAEPLRDPFVDAARRSR